MKDKREDDLQFKSINDHLDEAIDKMDVGEVEKQLENLSQHSPFPYDIEDSTLFAKRIIKQNKKGYGNMKKCATIVAGFVLTITIGVTAYATGVFKDFNFYNDKTTVQVRSNQDISEKEAKDLAKDAQKDYGTSKKEDKVLHATENTFSTMQDVESYAGVKMILPSYVPKDFKMKKEIQVEDTFNDNHNIYITYDSEKEEERFLGVTIITRNQPEESTIVTITDTVHKGTYQTPSGTTYELLKEDEGTIATVSINNIEYALVFVGVDEKEMHKIIDSVDLNGYME